MSPFATTTPETNRAATNRENAQHSTGPRTPEGKARIRFNAVQHGLYSDVVVLPGEDQDAFDDFTDDLIERFQPQTEDEQRLVLTLRDTEWRLGRVRTLESGVLALATEEVYESTHDRFSHLDDVTVDVLARSAGYLLRAREIDQLHRHEGRLSRLRDKTLRELEILLRHRLAQPQPQIVPAEVGFVPADFAEPVAASAPAAAAPAQPRVAMPKFSGPNRKEQRKQWLRKQTQKVAAA